MIYRIQEYSIKIECENCATHLEIEFTEKARHPISPRLNDIEYKCSNCLCEFKDTNILYTPAGYFEVFKIEDEKCICKEIKDNQSKELVHGDWCTLYLEKTKGKYTLVGYGDGKAEIHINYCPFCGDALIDFQEV